jgi:hypothetical protein
MKKRAKIWIGILILILAACAYGWHMLNKPHTSAGDQSADVTVNADTLYHQFSSDENAANAKYMNKVIEVSGKLAEIQHNGNSEIWILSTQTGGGGINCQLFAGTKVDPEPKPGDPVTVKGRCSGFLMDVNLSDCVGSKK